MPAGHGVRSRTRDTFSRGFRQKGYINLTTYLRTFKLGDYVDVKVNGAVHKVLTPSPPHLDPPPLACARVQPRSARRKAVGQPLRCAARRLHSDDMPSLTLGPACP